MFIKFSSASLPSQREVNPTNTLQTFGLQLCTADIFRDVVLCRCVNVKVWLSCDRALFNLNLMHSYCFETLYILYLNIYFFAFVSLNNSLHAG